MAVDLVVAPRHETGRHRVLGEVWVGPLVDVVRQAVAPRLEEFGRGPRVVDLVEVHLVRLGQAERAQQQRAEDEQDDQEQVEPVEAAAALVAEGGTPIRADRRLVEAGLEPADDADLLDGRARRPGRHRGDGGRGRGEGRARRRRRAPRPPRTTRPRASRRRRRGPPARSAATCPPAPGSPRRPVRLATPRPRRARRSDASSSARRARALGRSWAIAHRKIAPLASAMSATPDSARSAGPIPSQSLIPGLS